MQTSFYVSGFLYSPKTNQILLVQSKSGTNQSLWSTIGGEGKGKEEAAAAFQRITNLLLNINLRPKDIYPIYDYFHNVRNKPNYVFYAEVKSTKKFNDLDIGTPAWITFGEVSKLPFTAQTKQDIIVGERVIKAKLRDIEAQELKELQEQFA